MNHPKITYKIGSEYYTNFPFSELGDFPQKFAPVRKVKLLSYGENKYCKILAEQRELIVKIGYLCETEACEYSLFEGVE
jgi:hypothetical protein